MYIYTPILVGLVFSNQGLATLLGLIDANVMLPHQHVNGVGNILVAIALSSFVLLLPWKQVVLQTKDDVGTAAQRPALVHFLVGDCKAHAEGQYTEPEPRERLFQPELNLGLGGRGGGSGFLFRLTFHRYPEFCMGFIPPWWKILQMLDGPTLTGGTVPRPLP